MFRRILNAAFTSSLREHAFIEPCDALSYVAVDVVWFKRDLRIRDHAPLLAAAASGRPLLCLMLLEPLRIKQPDVDPIHLQWELDVAERLDRDLRRRGGALHVVHADAVEALSQLHEHHVLHTVHAHQETGVQWSYDRDKAVASWCKENGVTLIEHPNNGVVRRLQDRDGWKDARDARIAAPLLEAPFGLQGIPCDDPWPTLADVGLEARALQDRPEPGEVAALALANSFLEERGEPYRWAMSGPVSAALHASRLAPHLSVGSLSVRRVDAMAKARLEALRNQRAVGAPVDGWIRSITAFRSRLAWHDHFIQKMEMQTDLDLVAQNPLLDARLKRQMNQERFEAWCDGNTGWPYFDACMRHLRATGWTSFRMRAMMMAAAAYTLDLPWRETGLHLARSFLDYEPGIHWSQIGMQTGTTGINSVRAYSVLKQGLDHDLEGHFIRTWVPELAKVPAPFIHEPWTMSEAMQAKTGCTIGSDYPFPIVDEAESRQAGVAKVHAVRVQPDVKAISAAVYTLHGSRAKARARASNRPATMSALPSRPGKESGPVQQTLF